MTLAFPALRPLPSLLARAADLARGVWNAALTFLGGARPTLAAPSAPPRPPAPDLPAVPPAPAADRVWRGLGLALSLAQLVTPAFSAVTGRGKRIDELSDENSTLVTPAGPAFSIWGLIYPAGVAVAALAALPARAGDPLLRALAPWLASAFLGNAAWPIVFELGLFGASVGVIVWTLASLVGALAVLLRRPPGDSRAERFLVRPAIGVFAGWVTAATIVNVALALQAASITLALPAPIWAALLAAVAGGLGIFVTLQDRAETGYGLALVWALGWIAAARPDEPLVARAAALSAAAVLASIPIARLRPRAIMAA